VSAHSFSQNMRFDRCLRRIGEERVTASGPSKDRYEEAAKLLVELCKDRYGIRLSSIVLYGSSAMQDPVAGFSDLDVMLVIENRSVSPQDHDILRSIRETVVRRTGVEIHEAWVFGKSLLLSVPTIWEALSARTIYGEPVIEKAPLLDFHKRTSIKMMHDLRAIWERKRSSLDPTEKAKTALGQSLKFAQNALLYNGIVKLRKEEIVEAFEENFKEFRMRHFPRRAYENILAWDEVKNDGESLRQLVDEFEGFYDNLYWHIALKTLLE